MVSCGDADFYVLYRGVTMTKVTQNGKGDDRREGEDFPLFQKNYTNIDWINRFAETKQGQIIINAPNWGQPFIPQRTPNDSLKGLL